MTNIIQVLELIGQNASLQSPEAAHDFVGRTKLNEEVKSYLQQQNTIKLEQHLKVREKMICMIDTPFDDKQQVGDTHQQVFAIANL